MEFDDSQIHTTHIHVPEDQAHRLGNDAFYYDEYRSSCDSNVKVYYQKNTVSYADYRIGFWYIDPFCLKTNELDNLFLPLYEESDIVPTDMNKKKIWEIL